MKLWINAWRTHGGTGVARYLNNIVKHFSREHVADIFDDVRFCMSRPLAPTGVSLPAGVVPQVIAADWRAFPWENLKLAPVAVGGVLWGPSYTLPLFCRSHTVVTTHDATNVVIPEATSLADRTFYRWIYGRSARNATRVIVHNSTTSTDVANGYGVSPEKIRVVPLAPADLFKQHTDPTAASRTRTRLLGGDRPFFMCVGTMSRRRNVPLVIRGFAEFKRRTGLPHLLALAGRKPDDLDISAEAQTAGVADSVVHLAGVPDADLNDLYNAAVALVLAATYDSTSLPAFEAMKTGLPIIAPRTTAMLETTGGHALHLDALDERHFAEAFQTLATSTNEHRRLSEAGLAFGARFSWEQTAAKTMAVLEEAARERLVAASSP